MLNRFTYGYVRGLGKNSLGLRLLIISDLSQRKQRPVLIISNKNYNSLTKDILVAAITSQLKGIKCYLEMYKE